MLPNTNGIFDIVTANDKYNDSTEGFFIFFLRLPLGVLGPI